MQSFWHNCKLKKTHTELLILTDMVFKLFFSSSDKIQSGLWTGDGFEAMFWRILRQCRGHLHRYCRLYTEHDGLEGQIWMLFAKIENDIFSFPTGKIPPRSALSRCLRSASLLIKREKLLDWLGTLNLAMTGSMKSSRKLILTVSWSGDCLDIKNINKK